MGHRGRQSPVLLLCVVAMLFWVSTSLTGYVRAEVEQQASRHVVTGILSMLNVSTGKGMLKTDLDKPIFFQIGRPDHFSHVSIGDRVTIQLDEEGRTTKVIETLPSEMHEPPPPPAQ